MPSYEYILIAMNAMQFVAMIVGGYLFLSKPSVRANDRIDILETSCPLKHKAIDESVTLLTRGLELIKENHLKHIEKDIAKINEKMAAQGAQMEMMISLMKDNIHK